MCSASHVSADLSARSGRRTPGANWNNVRHSAPFLALDAISADAADVGIDAFLCRDDAERRRMTDAARRLRVATPVMFALFAIAGLAGMVRYGWQPPLAAGTAGVVYVLTWARNTPRRHRPEYAYAVAFVFAEVMFAASAGLATGPRAYGYVMLIMPVLPIAVAFPRRVVAAGSALAVGLILAVTFGVDLAEVRAAPPVAWCAPIALLALAVTVLVVRDVDDAARRSAFVDDLTGALNRSALRPRLSELRHQAEASGAPVGVIVADIDHFKAINDRHGHVTGDAALRNIARCLGDCVGGFDPVYRLGGEEFVILLPGRDTDAAHDVAQRMHQAVRSRPVDGVSATVSFGVAASVAGQPFDFDAVFERADEALYAAKQSGRDRVSAAREVDLADAASEQRPEAILAAADAGGPAARVAAGRSTGRARPRRRSVTSGTHGTGVASDDTTPVTEKLEHEHILEVNRRLTPLFRVLSVVAFVAIAAAIPWFGWHTLIAPVLVAVPVALAEVYSNRLRHPVGALAAGWLLFQTSIAIGFLAARGAPLFALSLFVLMIPGPSAMLPTRVAAVGTAYTALLMTAVALILDHAAILNNPAVLLFPLALLVEAAGIGTIIGRSAVGFRGAGVVDELTGLLNRTALRARLLELDAQAVGVAHELAILLIDLDHFKRINDLAGHARGDAVLREAAARLRAGLRSFESAYRVGGEEFLVLLPGGDVGAAVAVAERLRRAVGSAPCAGLDVTISIGVAVAGPGQPFDYRVTFARADAALYEAKRCGRDQVCVDPPAATARAAALAGTVA